MEVIAPAKEVIAVLRTLSCAGFAYAPCKALCEAAGWELMDDEPDLGYVRYAMRLGDTSDQGCLLFVSIAEAGDPPWAFAPLFYFEGYDECREPFDRAFRSLSGHLTGFLGAASRTGSYSYPHRGEWSYSFVGWELADTTLMLVQDELDIQFGMDVTLWVQPARTVIKVPVQLK